MAGYNAKISGTFEDLSGGGDPQAGRTKTAIQNSINAIAANSDGIDGTSLDAAWTATGVVPAFPYTPGGVRLPLTARSQRIMRAAPAPAEYEAVIEIDYLGGASAASSSQTAGHIGVCILSAAGTGISGAIHTADPPRIWLQQITAYEYVGVYGAGLDPAGAMKYDKVAIALHRNGNDYRMRYSNDGGTTWSAYTAISTVAFTPTQIGVIRGHTGGSATDNIIHLRSFRVFTPTFS